MSETRFQKIIFCETLIFKENTDFAREGSVNLELLVIRSQISASCPARRNTVINKVVMAVLLNYLFRLLGEGKGKLESRIRARNTNVNETIILELTYSKTFIFALLPEIPRYHTSNSLADSPPSCMSLLRCHFLSKSHF